MSTFLFLGVSSVIEKMIDKFDERIQVVETTLRSSPATEGSKYTSKYEVQVEVWENRQFENSPTPSPPS